MVPPGEMPQATNHPSVKRSDLFQPNCLDDARCRVQEKKPGNAKRAPDDALVVGPRLAKRLSCWPCYGSVLKRLASRPVAV